MQKPNNTDKPLRIKIFTRSFSLELYSLARPLFATMNLPIVRLTDQSADGYFYTMLKDTACDIAINIDEDCFIVNPQAILNLIDIVVSNDYANAGCPDGGSGCPRGGNPIVTNPFFNILNLKLIREKYVNKQTITNFDYKAHVSEMEDQFPKEILNGSWDFKRTEYEPYYPFFFWQAYHFKTLYLHGEKHADGLSTVLYGPNNELICLHSWFARFYNTPSIFVRFFQKNLNKQKQRIDQLISEAYEVRQMARPIYTQTDYVKFRIDLLKRWCIKVPQRIANWPNKWKRWYYKWENK